MGYENLKHDFPEMPGEIRAMIRNEVDKQIKAETHGRRGKRTVRRTLAASLAAAMLCGATVFAGVSLYRMQLQKTGEHGVSIDLTEQEHTGSTAPDPADIPSVRLEVGYLPQGMVQTDLGKYSFEDTLHQGGVSMAFFRMDTGDDAFEVQHGDVLSSEEFTAGGYPGVYLEYPDLYEDDITFHQRIYVAYTDVHYVMEMYAASDVSKEEALKIAESVKLIPTDETAGDDIIVAQNWSSWQENDGQLTEGDGIEVITSISGDKLWEHLHMTGDSFPMDDQGLEAKVADVKIADDISLLPPSMVDQDLRDETGADGKLLPATIQYIKEGDKDSLSEEVSSRQVPQKLVYATVEYTNTDSTELTDVLFFGSLVQIREADGQMQIVSEETPAGNGEGDRAVNHGLSAFREMLYYDVHEGADNKNYIASLKPGETATVHMAWIATEETLPELYLCLDTCGSSCYEFSDSSLKAGYVKIRQ